MKERDEVTLKVGIVQLASAFGQPEENKKRLAPYIEQASKEGVDTILFPELWDVGFLPDHVAELAQDADNHDLLKWMKESAREYNMNIVGGSIAVQEEGKLYNRCYVIDRTGEVVYHYDKAHLFPGNEQKYFTQGERNIRFDLDGIPCAVAICYDIRFPELMRKKALSGAVMLFVPAQWAEPVDHWVTLPKARAIENQMIVVAANGCGQGDGEQSCGQSVVYNAWGEVLVSADQKEGLLTAQVNPQEVSELRARFPVFKDRRIDLYF